MTLPDHVLVAGAGVSGLGAAHLLTKAGANCTVVDDNPDGRAAATAKGFAVCSSAEARERFADTGLVVTSPGWRPDTPLLVDATAAGIDVIGDVELCFRLDRAGVFGAPRTWLVVTGTNGKTTTTGMLAAMMTEVGADTGRIARACGNIGTAVGEVLLLDEHVDVLVAELSSFQLHWSSELVPDAGVLLNLAEDHIDWHGSFAEYAASKAKVLQATHAVAGIDDTEVQRLAEQTGRDDIIGFTLQEPGDNQVGVSGGRIVAKLGGETIDVASADGIEPAGAAGLLDALAAAAVALTQGAKPHHIQRALEKYRVAGHRGAVVHSGGGVDWVDNSKATNPHAADSALTGAGTVVWVAGGQLKGAAVDGVVKAHADQFRAVALLGVDRGLIRASVNAAAPDVPVFVSDSTDPEQAMDEVVAWAASQAQPGDTVLLAPAAASLDMFSGMSARGDAFAAAAMRHWSPDNK
ncbi:UDP-N-acetylmuramoylalanine--D-glutamate ligase [Corynebacterium coyleae]|uniref:UDP-N-acetylmuramoyl-L-alanine--D-glutamate ligase n=1 Tax=Corynebacterium coyleae TaxID=53374 RepID=UPI00089AA22D|nr:UDP-N-acetylmuramoyl-L-alanine--D-glutamate ligase [Corynebacterium coyleae]WJY80236.1 UDP-N-acetylmuramoylalanine--D-glutamate ligase [Corynebacterium coyleae]SEB39725.1 UDP-N-acetylmuramoylalanine--D-glutamate ligase [Corynebacterium coyleae]